MRVKILNEVDYTPTASDARSCWGSLQKRPSKGEGGKCGPMVFYFPKGRTPDLRDEAASDFIARGVAEPFDGEQVNEVSTKEILEGMAVAQ